MRITSISFVKFFLKIIAGIILTLILFLINSALLYYTEMSVDLERLVVYVASIVGITFAGFLNAGGKRSNGWFHGALAGFGYLLIILAINKIVNEWGIIENTSIIAIFTLVTFIAGSLGGIVGINLRQKLRDG